MSKVFMIVTVIALMGVTLTACNTVSGFGEDLKRSSEAVQRKIR